MCCIFTCCGWMIDLVQRLWTFTMSCCISSAVCCSFLTASMAGIALGYNYSLAEYIDLKETNVSVYIKRGVFDDEVADDMDWRRSGHLPVAGHIGEKNLITAAPEEDENLALRSGRRLDDSMFDSNDMNKFEGSLMKLTAKVPYATTTTRGVTSDQEMSDIISKYPLGSIDQLKAMQSLINMRKSGGVRDTTEKEIPKSSTFGFDERYLPHFPAFPNPMAGGRRQMPQNIRYETPTPLNAARKAVPDEGINEPAKWLYPKLPPGDPNKIMYGDYDSSFTYPPPVTPRAGPLRPTKTVLRIFKPRPTASTTEKAAKAPPKGIELGVPKSIDRDLEDFKEKLTLGKYEGPEIKEEELMKMARGGPIKSEGEDYEEDIKGLPVRKRRQVDNVTKVELIKSQSTNETNSKERPDQHLILKSNNIKRSILMSKFLIVSSELAKIPEMTATDSKMNVISKETVNRDQSIIPNDVTLGKLPSPKSLILDLLQSTVS